MTNHRSDKVGEAIKRELADMIRDEMKDPRIKGLISITHVEATKDLRYAKVYVSILSDDEEERNITLKVLEGAGGHLRSELAKLLKIRYTPQLIFKFDESIEYGAKINKILAGFNRKEGE